MKIVTMGDSITEGLGKYGVSYPDILQDLITRRTGNSPSLINLAHSAFQITDSLDLLPKVIKEQPDVVIIAHGITEAMIRPKPQMMRWIPPRWRRPGWLDPRAYFSHRKFKGLSQRIESAMRWRIKIAILKINGGATWMPLNEFGQNLERLLDDILTQTPASIILLTQSGLDERFFPGSLDSLLQYQNRIENIVSCTSSPRVRVCDVSQLLNKWDDFFEDHFHPNVEGHTKIASMLLQMLEEKTSDAKYEKLTSSYH